MYYAVLRSFLIASRSLVEEDYVLVRRRRGKTISQVVILPDLTSSTNTIRFVKSSDCIYGMR